MVGDVLTLILGGDFYFNFTSTLGYVGLIFYGLLDLLGELLNDSSLKNIDFGALFLKVKLITLGELFNWGSDYFSAEIIYSKLTGSSFIS